MLLGTNIRRDPRRDEALVVQASGPVFFLSRAVTAEIEAPRFENGKTLLIALQKRSGAGGTDCLHEFDMVQLFLCAKRFWRQAE